MATAFVGKKPTVLLAVQTKLAPSHDEWEEHLTALERILSMRDPSEIRGLVMTDGGAPSHAQRTRLNHLLAGRKLTGVVISGSPVVRLAVAALHPFNPRLRVFAPNDWMRALQYIDLSESQWDEALDALLAMGRGVSCATLAEISGYWRSSSLPYRASSS